jgi:hypothetical protein
VPLSDWATVTTYRRRVLNDLERIEALNVTTAEKAPQAQSQLTHRPRKNNVSPACPPQD